MKRYLITGGTGFLGRSLVRALVQRGDSVRSFDDDSRGCSRRLADSDVELIHGDIRDFAAVEKASRGVDAIVHLAWVNGTNAFYTKPDVILDVGLQGTLNVLRAAILNHVSEFFFASSSEVYQTPPSWPTDEEVPLSVPDPKNPRYSYGGGKLAGELLTIHNGRYFERAVIFRPHNLYGPEMGHAHVVPQLIGKVDEAQLRQPTGMLSIPIQGSGDETRAFIHIEDFTRGLVCLLDHGKHLNIYNIGNPEEVSIRKLVRLIGASFGREVKLILGTRPVGGTLRRVPDITKIQALGFEPRIPLEYGIDRVVEAYLAERAKAQAVGV